MAAMESEELRKHVETKHKCTATLLASVPVSETIVHVFKLTGHPKATRAYAWAAPAAETGGRKFIAMLDLPPILSPEDAIRAALVEQRRRG